MLLRSVSKHVKDQNWFAVGIDFFIVVIGVFIGIQVANWNDERVSKIHESAILSQLEDEFTEIKTALEKQIMIRKTYVENLGSLIRGLEGTGPIPENLIIKKSLMAARSTGRQPAQSAAYLQLTANGELAGLSNDQLKKALIRYHARLERDAFIFPELMRKVIEEMSTNQFVDYDSTASGLIGAAIDSKTSDALNNTYRIRSFDFEGLRVYERRYEVLHVAHKNLVNSDQAQLEIVNKILNYIKSGK